MKCEKGQISFMISLIRKKDIYPLIHRNIHIRMNFQNKFRIIHMLLITLSISMFITCI